MNFRILFQDENLIAIDKPAGFQVHAPETTPDGIRHQISHRSNCLYLLRKQIDRYLYPVHRLDRATSGVLVYALTAEAASRLAGAFQNREVTKTYFAVVRGYTPENGLIDHPLKSEHSPEIRKESVTAYERLGTLELPIAGPKHPTSRYSLVRVEPRTGRLHQIRRHFAHLSHPLIGDSIYGDGRNNRVFRELLGEKALFLKAYSLEFTHPLTGEPLRIRSRWGRLWHRAFDLFGICGYQ